jgi:O-antigen/teichoic acid export membrane protein
VIATSITSLIGAIGAVVFARKYLLANMSWLGWVPTILMLFVFVNGLSVGMLQEIRLIGRRRAELVFVRAVAIGLLPVPVLWLVRNNSEQEVWIAGSLCGGIALVVTSGMILWRKELGPYRASPKPERWRAALRFSMVSMGTNFLMSAPLFLVPFLVLTQISGAEYSVFYFSWSVLSIVLLIPGTIAGVLLIEGGRSNSSLDQQTSMALIASIGTVIAALVCLVPVSWAMALVLGRDYRYIVVLIPLLAISGVAWSISYVLISHSRIQEQTRVTWIISAVVFVGTLGPLVPLVAIWGTFGAGISWLFGNTIAAVVAILITSMDRVDGIATIRTSVRRLRLRNDERVALNDEGEKPSTPVSQIESGEVLG